MQLSQTAAGFTLPPPKIHKVRQVIPNQVTGFGSVLPIAVLPSLTFSKKPQNIALSCNSCWPTFSSYSLKHPGVSVRGSSI